MALALLTSALLLCLLVAVHRYLYRRLVKDVTVPGGRGRRLGAALVWLSAALTLLLLTAGPAEPSPGVRRIAERVAAVWPTLLLCLTVALLL
ncbi:metallophosphoesterase, partial [Streptomyces coelicoflavus]|nr:metallophosphoesterase [Streptomyces coelicoflavus]